MMVVEYSLICDCGNNTFTVLKDRYNGEYFECKRCKSAIRISKKIEHSKKYNEILKKQKEEAYRKQIISNTKCFKDEVDDWEYKLLPIIDEYQTNWDILYSNVQMYPNYRTKNHSSHIDFEKPIMFCSDLKCIYFKGEKFPKIDISKKELKLKIKKGREWIDKILVEGKLHYWDLIMDELL